MYDVNFNEQNLIVQRNGDGGDTCAREGEYRTGIEMLYRIGRRDWVSDWPRASRVEYGAVLDLLDPDHSGNLKRYTKPPYNQPFDKEWGTSRDQLRPHVIAAGLSGYRPAVTRIFWATVRNFFRCPNGDPCGPDFYGDIIRAIWNSGSGLWAAAFWPLLFFTDLIVLVNSVISIIKSRDPDDVGDDILHVQVLCSAWTAMPTPISWLARRIYSRYRRAYIFIDPHGNANPKDLSNYAVCVHHDGLFEFRGKMFGYDPSFGNGAWFAFRHYHRPQTHGNPLDELFKQTLLTLFSP